MNGGHKRFIKEIVNQQSRAPTKFKPDNPMIQGR